MSEQILGPCRYRGCAYDINNFGLNYQSRDITLLTKVHLMKVKAMVVSSSHVQILELDHKEG